MDAHRRKLVVNLGVASLLGAAVIVAGQIARQHLETTLGSAVLIASLVLAPARLLEIVLGSRSSTIAGLNPDALNPVPLVAANAAAYALIWWSYKFKGARVRWVQWTTVTAGALWVLCTLAWLAIGIMVSRRD